MYLYWAATVLFLQAVVATSPLEPVTCNSPSPIVCPPTESCYMVVVNCVVAPCPPLPMCRADPCKVPGVCGFGHRCNVTLCAGIPCGQTCFDPQRLTCPPFSGVTTCQITPNSCFDDSQCAGPLQGCCPNGCGKQCKELIATPLSNVCYGRGGIPGTRPPQQACGRQTHGSCPPGTSCVIFQHQFSGVCCPNPCLQVGGVPAVDSNGRELNCGQAPDRDVCPVNTRCTAHPADAFAVCCSSRPPPNSCPGGGRPIADSSGVQLFCGRGPNRVNCPIGSSCLTHPTDLFAICCPIQRETCETKICAWNELCYMSPTNIQCFTTPCPTEVPVCYTNPCRIKCPWNPKCYLLDFGCSQCKARAFCSGGTGRITPSLLVVMVVMILSSVAIF